MTDRLRSAKGLIGYGIDASDGTIGGVIDVFFDAFAWTVRYLVVDTGRWLPGRTGLIAPETIRDVDPDRRALSVALTKEQVRHSPTIDSDKPVSRQMEEALGAYYHWSPYWTHAETFFPDTEDVEPTLSETYRTRERALRRTDPRMPDYEGDRHLRSLREVAGYAVDARDGVVGRLHDLMLDTGTWIIRHLVVATRRRAPGNHVLVSPEWVRDVRWQEQAMSVELSRDQLEQAPTLE